MKITDRRAGCGRPGGRRAAHAPSDAASARIDPWSIPLLRPHGRRRHHGVHDAREEEARRRRRAVRDLRAGPPPLGAAGHRHGRARGLRDVAPRRRRGPAPRLRAALRAARAGRRGARGRGARGRRRGRGLPAGRRGPHRRRGALRRVPRAAAALGGGPRGDRRARARRVAAPRRRRAPPRALQHVRAAGPRRLPRGRGGAAAGAAAVVGRGRGRRRDRADAARGPARHARAARPRAPRRARTIVPRSAPDARRSPRRRGRAPRARAHGRVRGDAAPRGRARARRRRRLRRREPRDAGLPRPRRRALRGVAGRRADADPFDPTSTRAYANGFDARLAAALRALDERRRFVPKSAESTSTRPRVPKFGGDRPNRRLAPSLPSIPPRAAAHWHPRRPLAAALENSPFAEYQVSAEAFRALHAQLARPAGGADERLRLERDAAGAGAGHERCDVASTRGFRARSFRSEDPRFERAPRDRRSSGNEPKRADTGRARRP